MNRKIFSIFALMLAMMMIFASCGGEEAVAKGYGDHVKLGYKYIGEGKYEEAVVEFDKAMEIDEKKSDAYYGKAEAMANDPEMNEEKALEIIDVLNIGFEKSGDKGLIDFNKTVAEIMEKKGFIDEAQVVLKEYEKLMDQFNGNKEIMDDARKGMEEFKKMTLPGENVATVSTGYSHAVGLKSDGTVVAVGNNDFGQCDVENWEDIVDVSAGVHYTFGLRKDGTVVFAGNNIVNGEPDESMNVVSDWTDIAAISANNGFDYIFGLKNDGTVVVAGISLQEERCDVGGWTDIVAISAGAEHTVGLKSDGTVMTAGRGYQGEFDANSWTDIVAISAGAYHTVGLKSDGTVVATNFGDNRSDVSDWTDVVAISAGGSHTVGMKADGTFVATGDNYAGQCNVSEWSDIIDFSAGPDCTIGLKNDGKVVAVGSPQMLNAGGWKLF